MSWPSRTPQGRKGVGCDQYPSVIYRRWMARSSNLLHVSVAQLVANKTSNPRAHRILHSLANRLLGIEAAYDRCVEHAEHEVAPQSGDGRITGPESASAKGSKTSRAF